MGQIEVTRGHEKQMRREIFFVCEFFLYMCVCGRCSTGRFSSIDDARVCIINRQRTEMVEVGRDNSVEGLMIGGTHQSPRKKTDI